MSDKLRKRGYVEDTRDPLEIIHICVTETGFRFFISENWAKLMRTNPKATELVESMAQGLKTAVSREIQS